MKAIDEEWWVKHNSACRWEIRRTVPESIKGHVRSVAELEDFDFRDDDEKAFLAAQGDRARLIAAAPEMARLLLTRVDNTDSGKDSVHWYCFACGHGGGHNDDCKLIAVLRKAGVLPSGET